MGIFHELKQIFDQKLILKGKEIISKNEELIIKNRLALFVRGFKDCETIAALMSKIDLLHFPEYHVTDQT